MPAALWRHSRLASDNVSLKQSDAAREPSISTNMPATFAPSATPASSLLHEGLALIGPTARGPESGLHVPADSRPQVLLHGVSVQPSAGATAESPLLASCPVGRAPLAVIHYSSSRTSGSSLNSNSAKHIQPKASVPSD